MNDVSQANREWKGEARQRRITLETSRNIPSRFAGGAVDDMYIIVMGGNELDTGEDGCKWVDTLDEVPAAYDPNVDDSFVDGVARGRLFINGEEQDDKVLLFNYGSAFGHALRGENDGSDGPDKVWAFSEVTKPVAGGGSVSGFLVG